MGMDFKLVLLCLNLLNYVDSIDLSKCDGILQESEPVYIYDVNCYMFDTDKLYWDEAQTACRGRGGNLIQIPDHNTKLFTLAVAHNIGWGKKVIWIGASDRVREGDWVWMTGEKVSYNNWARGSPKRSRKRRFLFDDVAETMPDYSATDSDCAVMDIQRHGQWLDMPCHVKNIKHAFICQFEFKHPTSSTTTTATTTRKTTTLSTTKTTPSTPTTTVTKTITGFYETDGITGEMIENTTHSITNYSELVDMTTMLISHNISDNDNATYDNDRQIDNIHDSDEEIYRNKKGLISGLTVLGVMIILVLTSVMVVCQKMKSKQKIEIKDVIAFNNTVYNNGEQSTDIPEHADTADVHIYHIPEEFNDKDVINVIELTNPIAE